MNWGQAFLAQATSDFETFRFLNKGQRPLCHQLHYLQMATEKLSKAFFCAGKSLAPKQTHLAFVRLLKILIGRPDVRKIMGYEDNYAAFKTYLNSHLGIAEKIENLAPIGGEMQINAEYPWKDESGNIRAPVQYEYTQFEPQFQVRLVDLLQHLFRAAEKVIQT